MFFLERDNWKYKKWKIMEIEKRKKDGMKNWPKNQISDSMFSKGKTYVFPLETKSKTLRNQQKYLKF